MRGRGPCGGVGSQQQISSFPIAEYVKVFYTGQSTVVSRDILVKFSRPYSFFWIASIKSNFNSSDVCVHYLPLMLSNFAGANTFVPTGGEQWMMLFNGTNVITNAGAEGRFFRTLRPVSQFYVDIDHPNGASGSPIPMTFGASDDIAEFFAERH